MSDFPFMNLDEETINYERIQNAFNESDGGVEGHAGSGNRIAVHREAGERTAGARFVMPEAGIKPCPSEPFDLERFLAFVLNNMDTLVSHMTSVKTAHEFIGQQDTVGSIKLCADILASGFKERWPERSKLILEAENVVDLRNFRRVPDEVA